jgi:hypothetical protein
MLKATPKNWLSSDYVVVENDTVVAQLELSFFSASSDIQVDDKFYRAYREGCLSGSFILESATGILARAKKTNAFCRSFVVEYDGREYTLEAEAALLRKFVLLEDGKEVGSIYPEHAFTSKAMIELPERIPLLIRVFMFWLVAILWKRETDAVMMGSI